MQEIQPGEVSVSRFTFLTDSDATLANVSTRFESRLGPQSLILIDFGSLVAYIPCKSS